MRFESVTAHAFGPFRGAPPLKLTARMNVVHGPNESGKSSWHAALHAGLCGIRHGKGARRREDREFEERRKPWHGPEGWEVEVVVALADGRRIALRQDLAARSGEARDADLANRDYSDEINLDGTLDGSRWLGLNRVSFLNTACVRQAEMLGVRNGADALQDSLQKAADKADKDATAAQALLRLNDYRKLQIGSPRAPTRPLRVASKAVADARTRLTDAREAHGEYLRRRRAVKELEAEVEAHRRRIRAVRALQAESAASAAERRLRRVLELGRRHADGPPRKPVDDADLADRVAAAIGAWEAATPPEPPRGKTCEELEVQRASVAEEQRLLASARPRRRPARMPLAIGLGLLGAAGVCFQTRTSWLVFVGGAAAAAAGIGCIWWALERGRRGARDTHAAREAVLTERLGHVDDEIGRRRADDAAYRDAVGRHQDLQQKVHGAAAATGIQPADAGTQARALRVWQRKRQERLARAAAKDESWSDLQIQLAGQSLEDVEQDAGAKRTEAGELLDGCDDADLNAARADEGGLERLLNEEKDAQARLNDARGGVRQFAKGLPDIADAEDDCENAGQQLKRLQDLDRTLANAARFLENAQERVHRDVAGVLRSTLLERLSEVTGGRYVDCRVDPKTLSVEVCAPQGDWRNAELLSHGTTEQLYLLLRLALCRHLVAAEDETCPLILDDPVGACDARRRRLILETLLAISTSTQVIIFTHDDDVRLWGHRRLSPENDSQVVELPSPGPDEPRLGTRIANRFRGERLEAPFEELRGASIGPVHFQQTGR